MGNRKTGEYRNCKTCGREFYVAAWQMKDTVRNQGTYCSRPCKYQRHGESYRGQRGPEVVYHSAGYIYSWAPDHPKAGKRRRVLQHILVAEKELGRFLEPGEVVHHIDHDKTNNDPSNLVVLTSAEHARTHNPFAKVNIGVRTETQACGFCGQEFTRPAKRHAVYCSKSCKTRAMWKAKRTC